MTTHLTEELKAAPKKLKEKFLNTVKKYKVKTRKLVSLVNIKNDYKEIEIIAPPEI